MEIYITADTHLDRKNILKYEPSRQQFGDHLQMTEALIERWNDTVKQNDIIFHLGDVFFSKAQRAKEIASRLNGHKILIQGNHDHYSKKKYLELGFNLHQYYYHEGLFLSHYPQDLSAMQTAINHQAITGNVHGHVHSNIAGLDQSVYKCVSVELTDFKPVHIDEIKNHFRRNF